MCVVITLHAGGRWASGRQHLPTRNWIELFVFEKWLSKLAWLVTAEHWPKVMVPNPIISRASLDNTALTARLASASHPAHKEAVPQARG